MGSRGIGRLLEARWWKSTVLSCCGAQHQGGDRDVGQGLSQRDPWLTGRHLSPRQQPATKKNVLLLIICPFPPFVSPVLSHQLSEMTWDRFSKTPIKTYWVERCLVTMATETRRGLSLIVSINLFVEFDPFWRLWCSRRETLLSCLISSQHI